MHKKNITLSPTFERPYFVGCYLQSRGIVVNATTQAKTNRLIDEFLARQPIDKHALTTFLNRIVF